MTSGPVALGSSGLGVGRAARRSSAEVTAARSSKEYMRSARERSSPGVWGQRRMRRQMSAVSSRRRLRTVRMRCSYLVTRASR